MPTRFLIFIAVVQLILWAGHFFLLTTAVSFFDLNITATTITIAILSVTFVPATLLAHKFGNGLARLFYLFAVAWLGIGHFLLMAAVGAWITLGLATLAGYGTYEATIGAVLLYAGLLVALIAVVNGRRIRTTSYTVKLPGLPEQWNGRTAVWISDTHLGHINRERFATRVADRINKIGPDIVFVGGDLFDGIPHRLELLLEPLTKIQPKHGVFFITGNHEEFGNRKTYVDPVRAAGFEVLYNDVVLVDGLRLIGVGFGSSAGEERFDKLLAELAPPSNRPTILLKHSPAHPGVAAAHGVNLMISGHTHHGQILPFNLMTRRFYAGFDYGLREIASLQVITSSGTGTWGPPMRLGTRCEIVVIRFESDEPELKRMKAEELASVLERIKTEATQESYA